MQDVAIPAGAKRYAAADYKSDVKPIWCPGCGDFGVLSSYYRALSELNIPPEQAVIASGIGCSGRFPAFVEAYGFHGVHGRALPLATGIKMANPNLYVCAVGGDGDAFSIGAGHVPHAARRNVDITYIVMDNEIYGLTKGQPSPTSPLAMEKKAAPYGTIEAPLNPILMALAYNASFVARGFSARPKEVVELIKMALLHKGFAFLQIISPCVTFNDTYEHFKQITTPLPLDHDVTNRSKAMALALDEQNMYLGVFYRVERPGYVAGVQAVRDRAAAGSAFDLGKLIGRYRT
jgi:2-oxoglutarate ferredoxin oxidoreductase subunit beta